MAQKQFLINSEGFYYCCDPDDLLVADATVVQINDDLLFKHGLKTRQGTVLFLADDEAAIYQQIKKLKKESKKLRRLSSDLGNSRRPRKAAAKQRQKMGELFQCTKKGTKANNADKCNAPQTYQQKKKKAWLAAQENLKPGDEVDQQTVGPEGKENIEKSVKWNKVKIGSGERSGESDMDTEPVTSSSSSQGDSDSDDSDASTPEARPSIKAKGKNTDLKELRELDKNPKADDTGRATGANSILRYLSKNKTEGEQSRGRKEPNQPTTKDTEVGRGIAESSKEQSNGMNKPDSKEDSKEENTVDASKVIEENSIRDSKENIEEMYKEDSQDGSKQKEEEAKAENSSDIQQENQKDSTDGKSKKRVYTLSSASDGSTEEDSHKKGKKKVEISQEAGSSSDEMSDSQDKILYKKGGKSGKNKKKNRRMLSDEGDKENSSSEDSIEKEVEVRKKRKTATKVRRNMDIFAGQNYNFKADDEGVEKLLDRFNVYVKTADLMEAQEARSATAFVRHLVQRVYTNDAILGSTATGFPPRGKGRDYYAKHGNPPRLHPDGICAIIGKVRELLKSPTFKMKWGKQSDQYLRQAIATRCCELKNPR